MVWQPQGTDIPAGVPFGLTKGFASDTQKLMQWQGFLKKNQLEALMLEQVVADLRDFLLPLLSAWANGQGFSGAWNRERWQGYIWNRMRGGGRLSVL